MPSIPRISIAIPLYFCDSSLYLPLQHCFDSLNAIGSEYELLVIDDCSPLEIPHNWPVKVRNETNKGFTATVNKGLKLATGDIIIVMNDDIIMDNEFINRILHLDPLSPTIASPADTASSDDDRFGACWAITRSAYDLLGPLNEKYKHFFSDVHYYNQAKEAGVEIIKWSDIVLEHPESSTYKLVDKQKLLEEDQATFRLNV